MTIIGISPPEFDSLTTGSAPEVSVPITMQPQMYVSDSMLSSRGDWWLSIVGRLKPNVPRRRAEAVVSEFTRNYLRTNDSGKPVSEFARRVFKSEHVTLVSAATGLQSRAKKAAKQLYVLIAVVGLVLLSACLNLANLLVARMAARQREIAVRLSLGAARGRLIRQLLTESMLLAAIGGAIGIVFAFWGARLLTAFLVAGQRGVSLHVGPDAHVLWFTLAVSLITGVLFGVAPAIASTRFELLPELKGEQSHFVGLHVPWKKALVSVQIGFSLLLLIGSGLFLQTLVRLEAIDLGFDKHNVLEVSIDPTLSGYKNEQARAFFRELSERISRLPGVVSLSFSRIGLVSSSSWGSGITVGGYQPKEGDIGPDRNIVGPAYFTTLRIPMLRGRDFGPQDHAYAPHVAIVNESFARYYFGKRDPIGKLIGPGGKAKDPIDFAIVGVAKDGKYASLREETPRFWYVPYEQYGETRDIHGLTAYIRTITDPLKQLGAIRQVVRSINAKIPLFNVTTLEEQVDQSIATERMVATLSTFFGLLAALIAAIGLYGVMTYTMNKRKREIGIRMALGAQPLSLAVAIMGEAAVMLAAGIVLGIPAAVALGKVVTSLLFEVKPTDTLTIISATALAITVTLIAGYLPARRASRVDPTIALRYE
jgi:predicted permease